MPYKLKYLIPYPVRKFLWDKKQKFKQVHRSKYIRSLNEDKEVLNAMIAYNKYGGYCVPVLSHHRPAVQKILKGQVHEQETISYMIENCADGDIVHAGTFFGDFLPGLSKNIPVKSKVWAFEPNPESYTCAQITSVINNLQNVMLTNAGLGVEDAEVKMQIEDENGVNRGGGSKIVERSEDKGKIINVKIVSIDNTIPKERSVSIIQLDVERYEQQALMGAKETIERCKPILILENLPEAEWFSEHILALGYTFAGKVHFNAIYTT